MTIKNKDKSKKSLDHILPALKKNRDNVKLLISYSKFQDEIREIRNFLDIPKNGFKNDARLENWYDKLIEKTDRVINSPAFNLQNKKIREKLDRKEIDINTANKQFFALAYSKLLLNYFIYTCKFLVVKFNLPQNYDNFIRQYILINKIVFPASNISIKWSSNNKFTHESRHVTVDIYTELCDDDLRDIKRQVNRFAKKRKLPKIRKLNNLKRNIDIEECAKNRTEEYDHVAKKTYKVSHKEIADILLGDMKKGKKVYDIQRDLEKMRKRRFGY